MTVRGILSLSLASAALQAISAEPRATAGPPPLPLDLTRFFHTNFFAPAFAGTGGVLPKGVQKIDGLPFQIVGQAGLWGRTLSAKGTEYPRTLGGVAVGQKFEELHLVHHAFWHIEDGVTIARLRLNYEDGTTNELPIVYGAHVRDWIRLKYEEIHSLNDTNSKVWWIGTYVSATRDKATVRLFKSVFTNPHPEKLVKTLDIVSTESPSSYCLIAATVANRDEKRKADPPIQTGEQDQNFDGVLNVRVSDSVSSQPLEDVMLDVNVSDAITYQFGVFFTTNNGLKAIRYPNGPVTGFNFTVKRDGYVDESITLRKTPIPADFEIKLNLTAVIGGLVKDENGQPVEGATINARPIAIFDPGSTNRISFSSKEVKSDTAGRWSSKDVPVTASNLSIQVSHTNFVNRTWRSEGVDKRLVGERIPLAELRAQTATFVLQRGITLTGTVVDPDGQPVANASVSIGRDPYYPSGGINPMKTDAEGKFSKSQLSTNDKYLSVSAKQFAPYKKTITLTPNIGPLLVTLEKGKQIAGRVTDKQDQPIKDATVSLRHNGGNVVPSQSAQTLKTDDDGKFVWNGSGPLGVQATVVKDEYASQRRFITPDQGEALFKLTKAGEISGKVVDAETGAPISSFKVIVGDVFNGDSINWRDYGSKQGTEGKFTLKLDDSSRRYAIKVEADDYSPAVSATISNTEEARTMDFALYKGGKIKGSVILLPGLPVAGADVAMVTSSAIGVSVSRGSLYSYSPGSKRVKTDTQGQFEIKIDVDAESVVVVHKDGFARTPLATLQANPVIVLQQYGRIEGLVLRDGQPRPKVHLMLQPDTSGIGLSGLQYDTREFRKETDTQGRFVMDGVPPGESRITQLKQISETSWQHANTTPVVVKPGETTQVVLGGENSRSVFGRATVTLVGGEVDWSQASGLLSTKSPPIPSGMSREGLSAYTESAEYKEARKNSRRYTVDFTPDGIFRVDDIEPGQYTLSLSINEKSDSPSGFSRGRPLASTSTEVIVAPNGTLKLDLGTLQLKPTPGPKGK